MQKKIIALAVAAAAAGFASAPVLAQSSVTIYGSIDVGVRNTTNQTPAGKSVTTLNNNGNYNSNRWGIKDSEDLGNGMNAHFVPETGFMNGTGALDNASAPQPPVPPAPFSLVWVVGGGTSIWAVSTPSYSRPSATTIRLTTSTPMAI